MDEGLMEAAAGREHLLFLLLSVSLAPLSRHPLCETALSDKYGGALIRCEQTSWQDWRRISATPGQS